jgi:DNA-binding MarR family transcriptional regulator
MSPGGLTKMVKANRQEMIEGILKYATNIFRVLLPTVPKELLILDLTMSQLKMLFLLYMNGPIRMTDLAADLGVTLATATGLADRLVERDMVTRESQPDDRRVVLCRLSESGEKTIRSIWESSGNRMRGLLQATDTDKLQTLYEILESVFATAERTMKENN